jgi:hypothetical protein
MDKKEPLGREIEVKNTGTAQRSFYDASRQVVIVPPGGSAKVTVFESVAEILEKASAAGDTLQVGGGGKRKEAEEPEEEQEAEETEEEEATTSKSYAPQHHQQTKPKRRR